MKSFFDTYGYSVNPQDMRALSSAEIQKIQYDILAAMRNNYQAAMGQSRQLEEPNLDERFADFRVRLAAAIERNKLGH